jgi:two-component system chemotaxis sensor kinase CheA
MNSALERTSRLVNDLHHHVLRTRLMPLDSIAGRLPRIVRDLGRKTGKKVHFRLIGGDVGLDRVVLDELADPLVHLVRNAIDHGIREAGEVMVNARRERDLVLVEVRDNGVGMDPETIRRKAVDKGLLTRSQANELSDRDALMLICRPGFSTAAEVTETSGRGVGMDVVKSAVESLGGTLEIESEPQKGSRFRLRLPLSIAIIKLILIRCAGQTLALPVTRVQRIIELPREQLEHGERKTFFPLGNERVPVLPLSWLLGLEEKDAGQTVCIVLTEFLGAPAGLLVDGFVGHRDAFVKNLGFPLNLLAGLSGATIEGDGSVLFVVDPHPLLADWSVNPHD